MSAKNNMFEKLTARRVEEQQKLENVLTKERAKKIGRPRKRKDCTTITLTISAEDKRTVQEYAYENSQSVSDLLHAWIKETCSKKD